MDARRNMSAVETSKRNCNQCYAIHLLQPRDAATNEGYENRAFRLGFEWLPRVRSISTSPVRRNFRCVDR